MKLLVTNIQADAEISGSSAVDIVERAVYYLKEKGKLPLPVPTLITHYIINDPKIPETDADAGYVPLGHLETLEDPRLVRIGHYEDGVSGRHDASKVLTPFLESFVTQRRRQRLAVWLYDAASLNKLSQSVLEMLRAGIQDLAVDVTVFYTADADLDDAFMQPLPIALQNLRSGSIPPGKAFVQALAEREFDYAALFESSGMYRGEDLVSVISPLMSGRLDAVWGSRRLSLKDIEASYRLRYNHKALLGSFSYIGSHLLSAAYLTALRPLYLRHAVRRASRAGRISHEPAGGSRRQARQPVPVVRAAQRKGRRARNAGAVSSALARSGPPDDARRRPPIAGGDRVAADDAYEARRRDCGRSGRLEAANGAERGWRPSRLRK